MAKKEQLKSITELATMNPSLKESLAKFEWVKQQLEEVAKSCLQIKVTDDNTLTICENNLTKINDLCKVVEQTRVSEKKPYLEKGQAIDEASKYVLEQPESALTYLKDQKKAYILKIEAEKKRKDALELKFNTLSSWLNEKYSAATSVELCDKVLRYVKENAISEIMWQEKTENAKFIVNTYVKLFELKKEELIKLKTATPDEVDAIQQATEDLQEQIKESVSEPKEETLTTIVKKVRRPWVYELVDLTKVPKEWLMLDESKVNEWKKANQDNLVDGQVINGIKFFKDLTITA